MCCNRICFLFQLILATWEGGYNLQCQNLDSAGEADIRVAKVLWWYYFSKVIEFADTIFFVLRKKNSQITFLHVYHHATMFNIWWCVMNWIPCGQSEYLQIQFLLTITHTLSAAVKPCGFPLGCLIFQSSYMSTLVILFVNFYVKTYRKRPSRVDTKEVPLMMEVKNGFHKDYLMAANGTLNNKKAQ
ncbi:hypothetical protein JD844_016688 [Phrynosoma platyrhinos]|uniref:Elongation of very long chain fatty acids protein n=1 Tax=Phrynosoma platyrhinos TaxID=52577 RepID=A0ABQ7SKQ0_PHRPL|nr:hypothetical protein JD844_016688 [Phrynosoma platyrhinos]